MSETKESVWLFNPLEVTYRFLVKKKLSLTDFTQKYLVVKNLSIPQFID